MTVSGDFSEFVDWDNLISSWQLASRGKRGSPAVAAFEHKAGENLLQLQRALTDGTWQPGDFSHFWIKEPKRRLISAAPFVDRVVHHALVRVLEPRFETRFLPCSFANRVGYGSHRAVAVCQSLAVRYRYALRLDIQKYFPSIDHLLLKRRLFRRVQDQRLRGVISRIVESGEARGLTESVLFDGDDLLALCRPRGLPIGNLTSQFWSNCCMDEIDQFVRRELRCSAYLRYVDDLVLFGDDKRELRSWGLAVECRLAERLRLRFHPNAQAEPSKAGVPWLGFVVYPDKLRLKRRVVVNSRRRLRRAYRNLMAGDMSFAEFDAQIQGWISHVKHADSWRLRQAMFNKWPLPISPR